MKKWDYITLQQVSVYSGLLDTFHPYINQLVDYVNSINNTAPLCEISCLLNKVVFQHEIVLNNNVNYFYYEIVNYLFFSWVISTEVSYVT